MNSRRQTYLCAVLILVVAAQWVLIFHSRRENRALNAKNSQLARALASKDDSNAGRMERKFNGGAALPSTSGLDSRPALAPEVTGTNANGENLITRTNGKVETTSTGTPAAAASGAWRTEALVLTSNDIDVASIRLSRPGPDGTTSLSFRLPAKSSDEIEHLRKGPGEIVVNGVVVARGAFGSARYIENGTNVGLQWVFRSKEAAEAIAAELGMVK